MSPASSRRFGGSGRLVGGHRVAAKVGAARCIYNPNFLATGGLGYARYAAPEAFAGRLRLTTTSDLHPDVDADTGVHGLILSDLRNLMPKEN